MGYSETLKEKRKKQRKRIKVKQRKEKESIIYIVHCHARNCRLTDRKSKYIVIPTKQSENIKPLELGSHNRLEVM